MRHTMVGSRGLPCPCRVSLVFTFLSITAVIAGSVVTGAPSLESAEGPSSAKTGKSLTVQNSNGSSSAGRTCIEACATNPDLNSRAQCRKDCKSGGHTWAVLESYGGGAAVIAALAFVVCCCCRR